jgi:hypothetical protein
VEEVIYYSLGRVVEVEFLNVKWEGEVIYLPHLNQVEEAKWQNLRMVVGASLSHLKWEEVVISLSLM